jgi:GGDEF domain-containing protein
MDFEVKMKPKSDLQTKKLFLHVILLVIWNLVGAYVLLTYAPRLSLLGMTLNLFITTLSLTELFPYASWVSLILATGVFAGTSYALIDNQTQLIIYAVIGTAVFLITAIICNIYAHLVNRIDQKYSSLQSVADSLAIYDKDTQLMRWTFAKQTLLTEILRGRRYKNDVALIMFDYKQRDELTHEEIKLINEQAAEILIAGIRSNLDIAFINELLGLILPETGYKGALILAERLVQKMNRQVGAQVVAGISSFPQDAITDEEIVLQARAAVKAALESEQPVVKYHSLTSGNKDEAASSSPAEADATAEEANQEYINFLENIQLDEDQWVVWIEGFDKMENMDMVEEAFNTIDHIQDMEFLFLQENHLVIKIRSALQDLIEHPEPFPGWLVVKTSPANKYLLIKQA